MALHRFVGALVICAFLAFSALTGVAGEPEGEDALDTAVEDFLASTAGILPRFAGFPAPRLSFQDGAEEEPAPVWRSMTPAGRYEGWHFWLGIPLWLPSIDADLKFGGVPAEVDASFGNLAENMDGGIMFHAEGYTGSWGLQLDLVYASFSGDMDRTLSKVETELDMTIWEIGGFHRFAWHTDRDGGPASGGRDRRVVLDALFGLRGVSLEQEIDFTLTRGPRAGRKASVDGRRHWLVAYLGGRAMWELSDRWFLKGRFDWGFGEAIEFNAEIGVGFQIARWFGVGLDWRWLKIDYAEGSGSDRFKFDGALSGPVINLVFQF